MSVKTIPMLHQAADAANRELALAVELNENLDKVIRESLKIPGSQYLNMNLPRGIGKTAMLAGVISKARTVHLIEDCKGTVPALAVYIGASVGMSRDMIERVVPTDFKGAIHPRASTLFMNVGAPFDELALLCTHAQVGNLHGVVDFSVPYSRVYILLDECTASSFSVDLAEFIFRLTTAYPGANIVTLGSAK